ncbi:peptidase C15, pyroglutamyl peptidase I-like protein [Zopfia rhizophila CBS 207.26]|uniref:Peptidase C15, pyroglutamyl peptidase I-like protein n=1 Tax=Zopfia rhizophila CBS 207.26 TaxID=1314779 RepID=A0A6A6E2Y4_9PEZI|nr:peptidase C15, pyroglutamyl peptidase I-like protein [Zopfia rhizophila CBS 207.26]
MSLNTAENEVKVLVTGFGPFQNITNNPSWEIASRLSSTLPKDSTIKLIVHPTPAISAYHAILDYMPKLIQEHDPDIILSIGLDQGRDYFAVEQSAQKEGYHEIPDRHRKVFTRAENKKLFCKAPDTLRSSLDLKSAVVRWRSEVGGMRLPLKACEEGNRAAKGKMKGWKEVDVRLSDEVGNFTCGFIYYVGLLEKEKRGKGDVVFLHVPWLEGDEEIGVGVKVTEKLIGALVESWRGQRS